MFSVVCGGKIWLGGEESREATAPEKRIWNKNIHDPFLDLTTIPML